MHNFVQSMGRELEIETLKSLKFIERKTLLWTLVKKIILVLASSMLTSIEFLQLLREAVNTCKLIHV